MIYITGDTHGDAISRLGNDNFIKQGHQIPGVNDIVLIAGDFGCVFFNEQTDREKKQLDWLESQPFVTAFVDGNHENHPKLATFPVKKWSGGKVHEIRPNVLHLMRGEVFDIQGIRFFCFGGAVSIDKAYRREGISWWPEEVLNYKEGLNAIDNLTKVDFKVDIVLTHTAPAIFIHPVARKLGIDNMKFDDTVMQFLSDIEKKLDYKWWYFGHFHENWRSPVGDKWCRGIMDAVDVIGGDS